MIDKPTTLVLGAGASINYGFPSGYQLTQELIRKLPKGRSDPLRIQLQRTYGPDAVDNFHSELRLSARASIDAFLEHRPEFLEVGKGAIVSELLPKEQLGPLFPDQWHWYQYLLEEIAPSLEDLPRNNLDIITFNYDRTLEQFLLMALRARSGRSEADVVQALRAIPIIHVYGSLGKLPHQVPSGDRSAIDFGASLNSDIVRRSAEQVSIMPERSATSPEMKRAHQSLERAEIIIFLGFGYDDTNLTRLMAYGPHKGQAFAGSGIGLTGREAAIAQQRIQKHCSNFSPSIAIDSGVVYDETDTLAYLRRTCCLDWSHSK